MDKLLKELYREFNFPIGVMTTIVNKQYKSLEKGDLRGCTISSFRILEEGICFFSYNKSRIMASALDSYFAYHYLHSGQEDLAKRFAVNGLTCKEQFRDIGLDIRDGFPVMNDFHSLILGKIYEKIEIGDVFFYKAVVIEAEMKNNRGILHYSQRKYN